MVTFAEAAITSSGIPELAMVSAICFRLMDFCCKSLDAVKWYKQKFDLLEGKERHCEFDGVKTVADAKGRYCYVPVTHKVTLGEIVDLLEEFKQQPVNLMMPKCPDGSFAKKLFSLYLIYLPTEKFKYAMKMNCDDRGSFTELVHTVDCGQVSINISKPGIAKGQHWHNSKW